MYKRQAGFIAKCLNSSNHVVRSVARHGVHFQRMRSPIGRNAQHCASLFDVSLFKVATINKKRVWSMYNDVWLTDSDCVKLKVISELLCISHHYMYLDLFSSVDVACIIEILCTA